MTDIARERALQAMGEVERLRDALQKVVLKLDPDLEPEGDGEVYAASALIAARAALAVRPPWADEAE